MSESSQKPTQYYKIGFKELLPQTIGEDLAGGKTYSHYIHRIVITSIVSEGGKTEEKVELHCTLSKWFWIMKTK